MGQVRLAMADDDLLTRPPFGSVAYFWSCAGFLSTGFGIMIAGWLVIDLPIISHIFGFMHFYSTIILIITSFATQFLICYAYYYGRYSAPISIGWPLKLAMDLITLLLALSIRLLHSWNIDMLLTLSVLVLYTIYVHSAVQLRFRPRDMGILDLMLYVSMESLICLIDSGPRVYNIAILLLCAAIILCRCLFYSASKGGCHFEKDKEDDLPLVNSDQATNNANSIQVSGDDKSIRREVLLFC